MYWCHPSNTHDAEIERGGRNQRVVRISSLDSLQIANEQRTKLRSGGVHTALLPRWRLAADRADLMGLAILYLAMSKLDRMTWNACGRR